jgi:hypothetical protein
MLIALVLLPESHKSAPSLTGANFAELAGIANGEGWPGYSGAPRLATAAMGALEFTRSSENLNGNGSTDPEWTGSQENLQVG